MLYLLLGANLGDRVQTLRRALAPKWQERIDRMEKLLSADNDAVLKKAAKIVFVNGNWQWSKRFAPLTYTGPSQPKQAYWNRKDFRTFENEAQKFFGEQVADKEYFDGGTSYGGNESGSERKSRAQQETQDKWISQFAGMDKQNKIHFVAHSEGAAYAAGMAEKLQALGYKIGTILYLSADEGDEFETKPEFETYQLSYMYFERYLNPNIPDPYGAHFDWVIGENGTLNRRIAGVDKYGIAIRNDLDGTTVHGSTFLSDVFTFASDLRAVTVQSNLDGAGRTFYSQLPVPNKTKFYRFNDYLFKLNFPK